MVCLTGVSASRFPVVCFYHVFTSQSGFLRVYDPLIALFVWGLFILKMWGHGNQFRHRFSRMVLNVMVGDFYLYVPLELGRTH
jgi:hypothetical protein